MYFILQQILLIIKNNILQMKKEHQQIIDEQTQFLQRWLTSSSCHQSRDTEQFVTKLLSLVNTDQLTREIFVKHLCGLLQSHQSNLVPILQYCINNQSKNYQKQVCKFIEICFNQKNQLFLSKQIEIYLIHNIWTEKMKKYVQACKIDSFRIIQFLSLKMRSLNIQTRFQSINALFSIVDLILQGWKSPITNAIKSCLPQMIEKQIYQKQVCYYKGVLLQILQDQFSHIKKRGIELLGKAQSFFDTNMIRPLILYMLNDQHQVVRQTCLVVLSQISQLEIQKQDLSALLVCLKQNNSLMRSYTYESLSHINITSAQDFKFIMDRLFFTLSNRNQDKKKIYIVCSKLGKKYPKYVLQNIDSIYRFNNNQQPNWKTLVYRAKLITVAAIGRQNWPPSLPKYFANHYLYMRDVLLYAFQSKSYNNKSLKDVNQQVMDLQVQSHQININLISDWQLYQYVQATQYISQGFIKSLLQIIVKYLKQTNLLKTINNQAAVDTIRKIQRLQVMYNLNPVQIAKQTVTQLKKIINQNNIKNLKDYILKIRQNQTWSQLQKIQAIIFKVSNTDKSKIVISNRPDILKRSFLQFSSGYSQSMSQSETNSQVGYLRMSYVEFEEVNTKMCFYKIKFKCNKIRCIILYSHPPQFHVTDTFISQD